ncbi:N-6 DNA methylase, partial [Micromonospora sp. NPDC000207]|uniref:N-6 DNA methylase n=1 Tax=Micromonospora sp. NPDC000207 TaxID=3154246 RepID=UPI0033280356
MTAAEISRLAGVTRATVSNWRRRHPDFPAPSGGTETSPAYDLSAVRAWLAGRGQLPDGSPADDLRNALRSEAPELAHRTRLLPLVVAASRLPDTETVRAVDLAEDRLSTWGNQTARSYPVDIPGAGETDLSPDDAGLVRAVLRCLVEEGPGQTLEVLAEGEGGDSRGGGAYRTPPPVADLMAALLRGAGEAYPGRVFDPACGMGGLLLAALGQGSREVSGQDVVEALAAHAAARLTVADAEAGTVVRVRVGDSLRDDAFAASVADAVLCAPPYGHREWGHEDLAYDSRWVFGLPPKGESELAWVQHCLGHLTEGGRAVLLMPPGAALRPSGRRIRAEMVRRGALRAVVGLPPGVAVPLHIGLHLWILERQHPQAALPSTVLMVDAAGPESRTGDETDGRHSSTGWSTVRELVVGAWRDFDRHPDAFDPVQGVAQAVAVIDLLDEAVDLSPARHVRAVPVAAEPDELAETAYQVRGRLRRAATGLVTLTGGGVWPPAGAESRSWRTASVADLLRGDALTLLRAPTTV